VWMPEAVRREVDTRLKELGVFDNETAHHEQHDTFVETEEERRQREIYGRSSHGQETLDGLSDEHSRDLNAEDAHFNGDSHPAQRQSQPDLHTLAFNYVIRAIQDRRNVFMALLSILVLFLAMSKPQAMKDLADYRPFISTEQQLPTMMTSVSTFTSTEIVTETIMATTTSTVLSDARTSLESSSATSAVEVQDKPTMASRAEAETTDLEKGALVPSSSNISSPDFTVMPLIEEEEPALLEQAVQMLADDNDMTE